MIYLDNAASTKPREEVIKEMFDAMNENFGNPDAINEFSHEIMKKIKKSKKVLGEILGLEEKNIYFTAGGADGNNLLIQGIVKAANKNKKHLITTKIEHPSIYEIFKSYEEEQKYDVDYLSVDENGFINLEELKKLIREDTILVSVIGVNSEIGTIQKLKEIGEIIKEKNKETYFHVDFVQGLGHVNLKFNNIKIDALTVSSHKIHGPKGVGAIYIRENVKIKPIIFGSNSENGVVKRTIPTELILGFLKAVEILKQNQDFEIDYIQKIKEKFAKKIEENIENIKFNSQLNLKDSSPTILNISFKKVKGEVLIHFLDMNKIYASTGSACSSKKGNSRILEAINLSKDEMDGAIRFSFSIYNKEEEIDKVVKILKTSIDQIRKLYK